MKKFLLFFTICFASIPIYSQIISAGYQHSLALKLDGSIVCWGDNGDGKCNPPAGNNFVAVAGGYYHSVALKSDGSIVCWGNNGWGQSNAPAGNDFIAIAAGYYHSLALKSDGSIMCWGDNSHSESTAPAGNDFIAIAGGAYHCIALKSDGSIVCWGLNNHGQSNAPAGNNFIAIAAGFYHSLALKSDGSIVCWGDNSNSECNAPGGNNFVAISSHGDHSLALKSDGSVVGWGYNADGECNAPAGNNFVNIAGGYYHSFALKSDGSIVCWGSNSNSQCTVPAPNSNFFNIPDIFTGAAANITSNSAKFTGMVQPLDRNTTMTFEYGTTVAYGSSVSADETAQNYINKYFSHSTNGFIPNQVYHYRIVGDTGAFAKMYGNDRTFTTLLIAPTVTTDPADNITTTGARFNGRVNANNSSTTVKFKFGRTMGGPYTDSITAAESPVSGLVNTPITATIGSLLPNTKYYFVVVGNNGTGGYISGLESSFTTNSAPPTVTTNPADNIVSTGARLKGTINANNNLTTVIFKYGTTLGGPYPNTVTADQSPFAGITDSTVTKTVIGLAINTQYYYIVIGNNGTGGDISGTERSFTTNGVAPTVATNPADNITQTGARLNGTINANNNSTVVTFKYGITPGGPYPNTVTADQSPVTGAVGTSVTKTIGSLSLNTTYYYIAIGNNGIGGDVSGVERSFTTLPTLPTVTTNPATGVTINSAVLNGLVNANNLSTAVTFEYGLTAAYGTTVTADQSPVSGGGNTAVSKSISGLVPNTLYHYRVKGVSSAGTSNGSDQAFIPVANFIINGTITYNGSGLSGVIVKCTGNPDTTTGTDGKYSFQVPSNGSYTITPQKNYFTFTPQNSNFNNILENKVQNFAASSQSGISIVPNYIDYGTIGFLTDSRDTTLIITNLSPVKNLEINSISFNSVNSQFQIVGHVPTLILPNSSDSIKIRLKTDSVGNYSDQLIIANNSIDNSVLNIPLKSNIVSSSLNLPLTHIDFAITTTTKAKDTVLFTIKNNSAQFKQSFLSVINIISKTIIGDTSSFHFIKNDQNITLNPGQSDVSLIEFYPKTLGCKTATIVVLTNDQQAQKINISMNGTCGGSPKICCPISNINCGVLRYNQTKDTNIIVRNDGNLPLTINSLSVTGKDKDNYLIISNNNGKTLNNNESDTIKIRYFSQFPVGDKSAQIQISSNDNAQNPCIINLTGFMCSPILNKPFFRFYFDSLNVGQNSNTIVTLGNIGNDTLKIGSLFIDGPYFEEYSLSTLPGNIIPGGEYGVKVGFSPMGPGMRYARIGIRSNDPIYPESSVILIGYGKSTYYLAGSQLIAANNNADQNNTTLTWKKVQDAESYSIEISTDTNFTNSIKYTSIAETKKVITGLDKNKKYYFRVRPQNNNIVGSWSEVCEFIPSKALYEVVKNTPTDIKLYQNYPNPFNPSTVISYQLSVVSYVSLKIFDMMGREIATLVSENQQAGYHDVRWNAIGVPSGMYYYKIQAGSFVDMKKLVLLK